MHSMLVIAALVLLVPALVLTVQVVAARLPARRAQPATPSTPRPSAAILVPAHNEAGGIAATLQALIPQLARGDRLVVVADNCTDDTASVAAANGAEVAVRNDPSLRGKGYALDWGMNSLESRAPEIVVIVDADCIVAQGSLDTLIRRCASSAGPVQALYLMRSPAGAGLRTRMGEFAWLMKNRTRPTGYSRLGLPCQLMGTGMAFPWRLLRAARLDSGNIVEDLQLGVDMAKSGAPPTFCPDAVVISSFPESSQGLRDQRTRWEHGHIAVLLAQGPPLIASAIARRDAKLLALALDLCVPPVAAFAMLLGTLCLACLLLGTVTGHWSAFAIALSAIGLLTLSVLGAWLQHGHEAVSFAELLTAPVYAVAKVPLYLRLLVRRQTHWVRTKRDTGEHS